MKTEIPGITYRADRRRYVVRKYENGREVNVGSFHSIEEAKKALQANPEVSKTSETPILDALRSEFVTKKTNKQSSGAILMGSQKKLSGVAKKPSAHKPTEKVKLVTKEKEFEEPVTATDFSVGSVTELNADSLSSVHGKATLHLILKFLLKEAEVRQTSVFNVVVQEVEKLSKK